MNQTASNPDFSTGWVSPPSGRGTFDILQTCVVTIALCSWSSLCLNIGPREGRWRFLKTKLTWMFFTIVFPEVTVGMSQEKWLSAAQSVEDFTRMKHPQWSMRHAFFADMGGFVLRSPDFPPFPVDSQQLAYLVEKGYLTYPEVDGQTIWDKNKADGFARIITLLQIVWFTVQCVARLSQHLTLTTLELSSIAFIFCTLNTFFFWHHKPLDAEVPIILETKTPIAQILVDAGDRGRVLYQSTPLDFIAAPPGRTDFFAPWWHAVTVVFDGVLFNVRAKNRPLTVFANTRTNPPRGWPLWADCWGVATLAIYFAIYLASWNFHFTTPVELTLWRCANLVNAGLCFAYLMVFTVGTLSANWFARTFFHDENAVILLDMVKLWPRWGQLAILLPVFVLYTAARLYILTEAFVGLRSLPMKAYADIQWSEFVPHF